VVSFRPLNPADLPLLLDWFHRPHVKRWWGDVPDTLEGIAEEYDPTRAGNRHEHPYLIEVDDIPVGWINWYRLADEPDYALGVATAPGAVAIDLAIGEVDLIGHGLGPAAIERFLADVVVPASPDATEVWIDPHPDNARAVRAYRRVGFKPTGIVVPDIGDGLGPRLLLRLPLDAACNDG